MMARQWSWVSARSIGTSHLQAGANCEDNGAAFELSTQDDPIFVAIVSDGAGSAKYAEIGSQIVVSAFAREIAKHFRSGRSIEDISEESAREWIDSIRDRIGTAATALSALPRDFAATMVAVACGKNEIVACHIGDGGCAIRMRGQETWQSASWPAHGEYASTTFFVTDDPTPALRVSRLTGSADEIAVFSDGIERLVLDFAQAVPFDGFFIPMFASIPNGSPGRDRGISRGLKNFLDSKTITDRTDDDKMLIMARRVVS